MCTHTAVRFELKVGSEPMENVCTFYRVQLIMTMDRVRILQMVYELESQVHSTGIQSELCIFNSILFQVNSNQIVCIKLGKQRKNSHQTFQSEAKWNRLNIGKSLNFFHGATICIRKFFRLSIE